MVVYHWCLEHGSSRVVLTCGSLYRAVLHASSASSHFVMLIALLFFQVPVVAEKIGEEPKPAKKVEPVLLPPKEEPVEPKRGTWMFVLTPVACRGHRCHPLDRLC